VLGVLGVLGPTRMEYGRALALVETTARLLSRALTKRAE
jgi:transcriptional regulator of heat shock response